MKRIIIVIALLVITNICSYFIGANTIEWDYKTYSSGDTASYKVPYIYNTSKALKSERELCGAFFEMLHDYWQYYDTEYDENDSLISRHNFFNTCIMCTESYRTADSIMESDWEDFFFDWNNDITEDM